jgi:hypothetical protein
MAKVAPYHSKKSDVPNVYHDSSLCTEGRHIQPQYYSAGTAGRRRCEHCSNLEPLEQFKLLEWD